jgi:hypothetical protein
MGPSHSDMTRPTKTGIPRSKGLSNYLESRWFLGIDGAILIGRVLLLYMIDLGRLANAIFIKQWQTVVKSIQGGGDLDGLRTLASNIPRTRCPNSVAPVTICVLAYCP